MSAELRPWGWQKEGQQEQVGFVVDIARGASPGHPTILLSPKFTLKTSNPSLAASSCEEDVSLSRPQRCSFLG